MFVFLSDRHRRRQSDGRFAPRYRQRRQVSDYPRPIQAPGVV